MATNPVALPDVGFRIRNVSLVDTKGMSQMRGRRTETVTSGTPYWVGEFIAVATTRAEDRLLDAFIGDMQNAGKTFLGNDHHFCRPITYPTTSLYPGSFVGTGDIDTITSATEIDLSGFAANTVLKRGDRIEFYQSALVRSLHRITTDVTADGSGLATVLITPALNTDVFTIADTFNVEMPSCVMEMTGFELPQNHGNRVYKFSGVEVFY